MARKRSIWGWARTKYFPHKNHPANYKKTGDDEVEYLTFTHSPKVDLGEGKEVDTIPLTSNVSEEERKNPIEGKGNSHVFPSRYKGTRSALGEEITGFSLTATDKATVSELFKTLPVVNVPTTGGRGHFKRKKKPKAKK